MYTVEGTAVVVPIRGEVAVVVVELGWRLRSKVGPHITVVGLYLPLVGHHLIVAR